MIRGKEEGKKQKGRDRREEVNGIMKLSKTKCRQAGRKEGSGSE